MMEGSDLTEASRRSNVVVQSWRRLKQIYQSTLDRWTPHANSRWIGSFILLGVFVLRIFTKQACTALLDSWTPYVRTRWVAAFVMLLMFVGRILYTQVIIESVFEVVHRCITDDLLRKPVPVIHNSIPQEMFLRGWYIVTYALGIYHLNLFIAFLTPKIDPAMDFDGEDENGPALPTRSTEEFRPFIRRLPEFKFWLSVTKSTLIAFVCTFFDCFNVPVFWPILVMYFITLFCITMKRQIKHMIKYRYLPFTHNKPKYQTLDATTN